MLDERTENKRKSWKDMIHEEHPESKDQREESWRNDNCPDGKASDGCDGRRRASERIKATQKVQQPTSCTVRNEAAAL